MEWLVKKFSSSLQQFLPTVRAEESEEVQDPQVLLRDKCGTTKCNEARQKLETCNARVRSKKQTAETCDEEMIDFINCLDHCVSETLFSKLK